MKKNLWTIVKPLPEGEAGTSIEVNRATTAALQDKDEQALGIIITSLGDNFIHYIDGIKSAMEAWETLLGKRWSGSLEQKPNTQR